MSSELAIEVAGLCKSYQIYDTPRDRLKQFILPRLRSLIVPGSSISYYREFRALQDVSLEVRQGETVGIIGRNGSGKSTLLQILCGTLTPTSGQTATRGRVAALLELGSGFNPEFTGSENIYMNASVLGLTRREIESRFTDIVQFADIGGFIDQPVKTYSSGMLVRLAFAVIAHVDADILVIDEALAVGDAFFTQKCMRFLRNFMKTGTVLFVSHDTGAIRSLCSRAIWLERGQVLQQGTPKEVCESYLEAFYEEQQGKSSSTRMKVSLSGQPPVAVRDQRSDFINLSNLRNDIQLFEFDPQAPSFGRGAAQIIAVRFLDSLGQPLSWIVGGEEVMLRVEAMVHQPLDSPIIGFFIKDRTGQYLFGDNTFISYLDQPVRCTQGELLSAEFTFCMPRLAAGDYAITVAIADGTQHDHVQHHWVHDALFFKSESTSVAAGLVGIPMTSILLARKE